MTTEISSTRSCSFRQFKSWFQWTCPLRDLFRQMCTLHCRPNHTYRVAHEMSYHWLCT